MKHALAACVFDSHIGCTVYTIPKSEVEHRLTMEQLSFGLHAFNKALHGKVARYGIQHQTTFDQIGRWLEDAGSLAYTSPLTAAGLLSRPVHDVNAIVEVTPLSSTGQRVGETTVEEQAASSLLFTVSSTSEKLTLWEAVQLAQTHLVARHASLAPSHTNNNNNSSNSHLLSSARYRQRVVMDAAMATHRHTTLLTAVAQRQPGANPIVGFTYVPYAVENIQHVFEWALGEDADSVQSTLTTQLQSLMTDDLPALLVHTPCKTALFAHHEPSRLVHVAHTFTQAMTMAQTLESVTETLFHRKLQTLSEEHLLRGEVMHAPQTVMLARDLASHSVAQLLCYRRLTQFQSRYVACWQWLWQHPLFDLHAFAKDQDNDGGVLTRWQAVLPAIDERILPPALSTETAPELVYHRLCHDLLLPVSPADALAASAAPSSSSSSSLATAPQPAFTQGLHATLLSLVNTHVDASSSTSLLSAQLGAALWVPMQWFHTKIQHMLQEQLYAGHSMQELDELLDADIRRLRRVLLYLILVAFVSAYKSASVGRSSSRSSASSAVQSLFGNDFVLRLHGFFAVIDGVSPFHVEEVQLLVALVLIDLDDVQTAAVTATTTTEEEAETILGNETHWVHAWRWLTQRHGSPDLYLIQPQPLRQYPALRYLLEHVRCSRDEGNDSARLPWSLTDTSTESQRLRWNDELALSSLLFAVVQRWIRRGHYHAAYSLQSIAPYPRHIYLGVMAWIASIPEDRAPTLLISGAPMDPDTLMATQWWHRLWDEARVKMEAMPTASESLRTLQDMTQFLCRWTIAHGCFADFLTEETLQLAEMDAIVQYLTSRAEVEVVSAVCPSPAVDTLVGFLIQHRRVEEARHWHDRHVSHVGAARYKVEREAKRVVDERAMMIAAAEAQLWTIPRVDYDLCRNVHRCHKILAQLAEIERVAASTASNSSASSAMDTTPTTTITTTSATVSVPVLSSGSGSGSGTGSGQSIGGLFSTIRRPAALVSASPFAPASTPVPPPRNNLFARFSSQSTM